MLIFCFGGIELFDGVFNFACRHVGNGIGGDEFVFVAVGQSKQCNEGGGLEIGKRFLVSKACGDSHIVASRALRQGEIVLKPNAPMPVFDLRFGGLQFRADGDGAQFLRVEEAVQVFDASFQSALVDVIDRAVVEGGFGNRFDTGNGIFQIVIDDFKISVASGGNLRGSLNNGKSFFAFGIVFGAVGFASVEIGSLCNFGVNGDLLCVGSYGVFVGIFHFNRSRLFGVHHFFNFANVQRIAARETLNDAIAQFLSRRSRHKELAVGFALEDDFRVFVARARERLEFPPDVVVYFDDLAPARRLIYQRVNFRLARLGAVYVVAADLARRVFLRRDFHFLFLLSIAVYCYH